MTKKQLPNQFIDFLSNAKTPYHAVSLMIEELKHGGYKPLKEEDHWSLQKNGRYYVTRGDTSLVAFDLGDLVPSDSGFHLVGAHTDSPCLKVKDQPEKSVHGYLTLGVEPYGGILLSTWFDRDLSLAGRVSFLDKKNMLCSRLLDIKRTVGIIPNLAIHLNPKVNENGGVNKQKDLPVLVLQDLNGKKANFRELLKQELLKEADGPSVQEVLDFDLQFYGTQAPAYVGFSQEFISGQKLDNLLSCFTGLKALLDHSGPIPSLLVCNDHEEVGSSSVTGAAGTFLKSILERICETREAYRRTIARSILVSVDNAHGVHPNYADKHDENHRPLLNRGPVIKINANQRYATNSTTSSFFRMICKKAGVPVQSYVNRSDMSCGTTIGPITSSNLGVNTLDIGVATFAMHSIRETCGTDDIWYLYKALRKLYETTMS